MLKKPYHLRFFVRRTTLARKTLKLEYYNMQIEYRGDSIEECIHKAMDWCGVTFVITSYTIRRGKGKGKNVPLNIAGFSEYERALLRGEEVGGRGLRLYGT